MNTLNKILKLCKMSGCKLHSNNNNQFTIYTPYYKLIISNTDTNEALHYLRQYLNNPLTYFKNNVKEI